MWHVFAVRLPDSFRACLYQLNTRRLTFLPILLCKIAQGQSECRASVNRSFPADFSLDLCLDFDWSFPLQGYTLIKARGVRVQSLRSRVQQLWTCPWFNTPECNGYITSSACS
ncbi:hypothetical protein GOODEAATRI_026353 [Goodea atripinnis]|uniref:Uncharacterized protein n=1 Tax=Goodea atripinnis TaxID=208336 RepID=A0ABV0MVA6_9TELE